MKKHEILPWNAQSIEQLEDILQNEAASSPQLIKHSTTLQFYNLNERALSIKAIANGRTEYALDDVSYKLNRCGFRGDWELTLQKEEGELWIAMLGCSFTFGEGVPVEHSWPFLVEQQLNASGLKVRVFNFGKPGASAVKGSRYLSLFSDYMKFDYVVMVAPHAGRVELPTFSHGAWPIPANLIPNYVDQNFKSMWESYYRFAQDDYFAYDTLRSVDHAKRIAESHSGKFMVSSWDPKTHDMIREYSNADALPYWQSYETEYLKSTNMARDGSHPGKGSHAAFAGYVVKYINDDLQNKP